MHSLNLTVIKFWLSLGVVLCAVHTSGCSTPPRQSRIPALRAHPDYSDAMRCAPDFTTGAMKAIADLEAEATGR